MALLNPQQSKLSGTTLAFTGASASDTFKPSSRGTLLVKTAGTATTATVVIPGNTEFGAAQPDIAVSCPATGEVAIGPFPPGVADPATGLATVTFSATTSVEVAYKLA